jgi:hypothetical protein
MVFSGNSKSPLMTTKLPLLPNSGDKVAATSWLLIIGRNCQIVATFSVAANNQSLAATFGHHYYIFFFLSEKMLKITLESPLMT